MAELDINKLQELMESWDNLAFIMNDLDNRPELFPLLLEIALADLNDKSWRAAWMADKIHDKHPGLILPFIDKMISRLKTPLSTGTKRHFLKLLSMNTIPEKHEGFLVEFCFSALTSAKEPPAVRVHAMQILFNISEKEPELKSELFAVINHEMEFHSTAGIISRGKKLAKKLHNYLQQKKLL